MKLGNERSDRSLEKALRLFIADSGSTQHAVSSKIGMTNYRLLSSYTLFTASAEHLVGEGMGDLYVDFRSNYEQKPGTLMIHIIGLKDIIYVPGLISNLQSSVFASHSCR